MLANNKHPSFDYCFPDSYSAGLCSRFSSARKTMTTMYPCAYLNFRILSRQALKSSKQLS
ncbi:hypothetical protein HanPSC8_Chr15g0650631 [Helianthus annuus]|nr:hypothetical protein HanPSC8_Chr15g0650631 [Helianthus annuus]